MPQRLKTSHTFGTCCVAAIVAILLFLAAAPASDAKTLTNFSGQMPQSGQYVAQERRQFEINKEFNKDRELAKGLIMASVALEVEVSTVDELYEALANAKGGERIVLAGGNYGDVTLSPKTLGGLDGQFPTEVIITSADPENPATFEGLHILGGQNMTFDGILVEHVPEAGENKNTPVVEIGNYGSAESSGISIINSDFVGYAASAKVGGDPSDPNDVAAHGGMVEGNYAGIAVSVDGADITLSGNDISGFYRGISVKEGEDISITGNSLHDIRSDGMTFGEVKNVLIEDNEIRDLTPWRHADAPGRGDHPDMIQFWTTNSDAATENVIIRDNLLIQEDVGDGVFAQGIFMRNPKAESDSGTDMFYKNITIEGNVIYNSHINSLVVGEADGLTVANNILLQNTDNGISKLTTPIIAIAERSLDVTVIDNVVPELALTYSTIKNMATLQEGAELGWTVESNSLTALIKDALGLSAVSEDGVVLNYNALLPVLSSKLGVSVESLLSGGASADVAEPEAAAMAAAPEEPAGPQETVTVDDRGIETVDVHEDGVLLSRIETDYSDVEDWDTRENLFEDGELAETTTTYDDGLTVAEIYVDGVLTQRSFDDVEDSETFQTRVEDYDDEGDLTAVTILHDSGMYDHQEFAKSGTMISRHLEDRGDSVSWESRVDTFDEDGQQVSEVTRTDNGVLQTIEFEDGVQASRTVEDQDDKYGYASKTWTYEDGTLASLSTTRDNGLLDEQVFAADGDMSMRLIYDQADAFVWEKRADTFDSDGALLYRSMIGDDGSVVTRYFGGDSVVQLAAGEAIPDEHIAWDYVLGN